MKKKSNLLVAPTHQTVVNISLMLPIILNVLSGQSVKGLQGQQSLGWEILSKRGFLSDLIRYQSSPYMRWNGRCSRDGIVISTTGCRKSINYCTIMTWYSRIYLFFSPRWPKKFLWFKTNKKEVFFFSLWCVMWTLGHNNTVVYLHDWNDSGCLCWKTTPWFRNFPGSPRSRSF